MNVKGNAQLDYEETIIQSGIAYEVARWQSAPGSFTALDLMGSARYWNQDVDLSLRLTGTLNVDLRELGLQFQRSRRVAIARSGDLEWVDPVVGARIRHQIAPGKELRLVGDVGGFGAGASSLGKQSPPTASMSIASVHRYTRLSAIARLPLISVRMAGSARTPWTSCSMGR